MPAIPSALERLRAQMGFIIEVDKVKDIIRKTPLFNGKRMENDAEHSWHIALMAMVLREWSNEEIELERVIKMMLIHDLVEIDAGDVFLYDPARADAHAKEVQAAERIFGLLPPDQASEFRRLWDEFEARQSPEARFAAALDRLEPLMQNWLGGGVSWRSHGVGREQVLERNAHIAQGSAELWEFARAIIDESFPEPGSPAHSKV